MPNWAIPLVILGAYFVGMPILVLLAFGAVTHDARKEDKAERTQR